MSPYVLKGLNLKERSDMMSLKVGELFAEFGARDTGFSSMCDSAASKMASVGSKISSIGGSLTDKVTKPIVAIGAGFVGLATKAATSTNAMNKALNTLQTQTGATETEMQGFEGILKSIYGQNYGDSFEDVAQSMAKVEQQTGMTGSALEETTTNALALRDVFDWEVDESLRAAQMMVDQFGVSSEEAYNLLAQGAQNGLDKNQNLLDSINEYSVHFSQMGFSAEEMFGMISSGAQTGVFDIDKLGDAVKEFGIRAKDGSSSTMEAFKSLGLDAEGLTKKFANGGQGAKDAFMEVNTALMNCDDKVLQNQAGVALWGTMWEDMGADAIAAMLNVNTEFDKTRDSMEQIKAIKYDDIGSAFEGIGRQLETGLLIPIGEKVLPYLNDFANWFQAHLPEIQNAVMTAVDSIMAYLPTLAPVIQGIMDIVVSIGSKLLEINPIILAVAAAIGPVVSAIGTVVSTCSTLISGIGSLVNVASNLQPILTAVGTAIGGISAPAVAVVAAIAAFSAAVVYCWKTNDEFRNNILQAWESIKSSCKTIWEGIKSIAEDVFNGLKSFWSQWGEQIKSCFGAVMKYLSSIFKTGVDLISDILKVFSAAFQGDWKGCWEAVKQLLSNAWNNMKDVVSNLINAISQVITTTLGIIKSTFTSIWEGIKSLVSTVFQSILSVVTSSISSVLSKAKELGTGVINAIKELPSSAKSIAGNFIRGLVNGIKNGISSVCNSVKDLAKSAVDSAKSALGIHSPSRVMMEVGGYTGEGFQVGLENTKKAISKVASNLVNPDDFKIPEVTQDVGLISSGDIPQVNQGHTSNAYTFQIELNVSNTGSMNEEQLANQISRRLYHQIARSQRAGGLAY